MCNFHMNRRLFMTGIAIAPLFLSGCFEDNKTGPVDIKWDRDAGTLCNMLISDARFVAEVRGGAKRKVYKFDDIGCAINWLNDQPWAGDDATEIWVADIASTRSKVIWLNARDARFVHGEMTPMNYGYAAFSKTENPTSIDFVKLTQAILADTPNHICKVPPGGTS